MNAEDPDNLTPDQLVAEATTCFVQADKENTNLAGGHERRLLLHLKAQFYLTTAARKRADASAELDKKREHRRFLIELGVESAVILLIGIEIALSVYFGIRGIREGERQVEAMQAATDSLRILAADQTASLKILQQEQAERIKKPRLTLYVGSTRLDKAYVRLKGVPGSAQDLVSLDLSLKNEGDAPVSTSRLHALTPDGIYLGTEQLITVPESEPPAHPSTRRVTLQLPPIPAGETVRVHLEIYAAKGHRAFKIPFTLDAPELQAVAALGSVTVLPARAEE